MMAGRSRHWIASALGVLAAASLAADAQKTPALHDVLRAAADYVRQYPEKLATVAAEETGIHYDVSGGEIRVTKRLTGDLVLAGLADGIEAFRDVVAIDNAPLRPGAGRLAALFEPMTPATLDQARAWSEESVTRYLSPNLRALDQPALALLFLRREHQARSAFTLEGVKTAGGARVAVVKFVERDRPRIVRTTGGGGAVGRFWIEAATGIVRQTEVAITNEAFAVKATVTYASQPALGVWVPIEMSQQFDASGAGSSPINYMGANSGYNLRQSFEARATYAKFRRIGAPAAEAYVQKNPALADVLQAAGGYIARYTGKLSAAVAAEETLLQFDVSSGQVRGTVRLTSDIVLAGLADGIEGFRDVVAIDNAPLRRRDDRLAALFGQMTPAALQQARAWSAESVERYISPNLHALDQPLLALEFLRKEQQGRSTFKIDSVKTSDGVQVAVLRFSERGTPRLVPTAGGAGAAGRVWIDVATGIVRQTEIGMTDDQVSVRASVKYALDPGLDLWVPIDMFQQFDASGTGSGGLGGRAGSGGGYAARQSLEGRAKYAKFRRLGATASARPRDPSTR